MACVAAGLQARSAFFGSRNPGLRVAHAVRPVTVRERVAPRALFGGIFGGKSADAGSSGNASTPYYICIDCGWIYDGDFKKAPGAFKCPACSSPKSRFKVYKTPVKGRVNNTGAAMKKRMQERAW